MLGVLTADEIEGVLRRRQVGRLGVTDGERVYIFPLTYGYDGGAVYLVSRPGLKLRLMRAHPEVCFEVEEIETPARWRTVMAHGRFEELTDPAERERGLSVIVSQGAEISAPSLAPYLDGPEAIVVYRVRLAEKNGRFENDPIIGSQIFANGR